MGYTTNPAGQSVWQDNQLRSGGPRQPGQQNQGYQSPGWYGFGYDPLTGGGSSNTKVEARYGAGAQPQIVGAAGTQYQTGGLGSQMGQMASQGMQQAQQQGAAAQAAQLRGMNTPGGVDQWGSMMQGMQQARQQMMNRGSPMGQAYGNATNTAAASALRDTNTPGGMGAMQQQQGMQAQRGQAMTQGTPNWAQMMGRR